MKTKKQGGLSGNENASGNPPNYRRILTKRPNCCAQKPSPACAFHTLVPANYSITWRRKWQPTPVFLPGKSHGRKSLVGYGPWGRRKAYSWETQKSSHGPHESLFNLPSIESSIPEGQTCLLI